MDALENLIRDYQRHRSDGSAFLADRHDQGAERDALIQAARDEHRSPPPAIRLPKPLDAQTHPDQMYAVGFNAALAEVRRANPQATFVEDA